VYDSWGACSEYVFSFSGAVYQSYSTMMQVEESYAAFLKHQNKDRKPEHVTLKPEHVARKLEHITNMWCWKD
jgi:viroplasmin and RNaseH domain-containing protein